MIQATICTIGDEILIGQVVDTNSSRIALALEEAGIKVKGMVSVPDNSEEIENCLVNALKDSDIVITTGGLGPTKDDITKAVLMRVSGSKAMVEHAGQLEMVHRILRSRGLDVLPANLAQAMVPEKAEVIVNRLGTAPIMVFRGLGKGSGSLYSLPGVPFEAVGALPDVMGDIRAHYAAENIMHRNIMVYGVAESALAARIAEWEDALESGLHLAYLPNPLTGIRLRLSAYGGDPSEQEKRLDNAIQGLLPLLGEDCYSLGDDTLEHAVGTLLKRYGRTVSAAESCTGGEISHLFTSVPGSSAYYLGSVTSYAISVKEKVLGVPSAVIEEFGVVSSEVAAAMAEGVRRVCGSDYAVSTTGLAGPDGDERNPVGTVWIGVSGPLGTRTKRCQYKNDRRRNIQRFAASALDFLRRYILEAENI